MKGSGDEKAAPLLDVTSPSDDYDEEVSRSEAGAQNACCRSKSQLKERRDSYTPRLILISVSCVLTTLLSGGVVLGFGTLQEQLLLEGQYSSLCTTINATCIASFSRNNTCHVNTTDGECAPVVNGTGCYLKLCGPQDRQLETMYTYTYAVMNAASAVIGIMVDSLGPRAAAVFGLVLSCAGFVLLGLSDSVTFDYFIVGFCLIGAGGIGPYFAHFNFSNLFRKYQGVYVSAITGLFNLAGLNFYWLFNVAGGALRDHFSLTSRELRQQIFIMYAIVAGAAVVLVLLLYPDRVYHDGDTCVLPVQGMLKKCDGKQRCSHDTTQSSSGGNRDTSKSVLAAAKVLLPSSVAGESTDPENAASSEGEEHGNAHTAGVLDASDDGSDLVESPRSPSTTNGKFPDNPTFDAEGKHQFSSMALIKHSLKRAKFWWLLIWWCVCNLEVAFLGGSFPVILEALNGTAADVSWQTSILSNLPLLIFNPIIGIFLEKHGFSFVFLLGNLVACACLILLIWPVYAVQEINLVVFSMQKAFVFTVTFAFLLMEFPIEIYGTLAAAITFVAFGVGFLVTPLLDLIDISSALVPSSSLNGGYVLPGAVVLGALIPCFCLAYVTRPVSERQRRYRLQKRKTTISDLQ